MDHTQFALAILQFFKHRNHKQFIFKKQFDEMVTQTCHKHKFEAKKRTQILKIMELIRAKAVINEKKMYFINVQTKFIITFDGDENPTVANLMFQTLKDRPSCDMV